MHTIGWRFDNSYALLPGILFTRLLPTAVRTPRVILFNAALAEEMGLDFSGVGEETCAALWAGNRLPAGAAPLAQAYAGHQFGHFTMLGDGRAIVLGEHLRPDQRRVDVQFKGSGRTPYSRNGDGRAALGPMLREYVMSEAMYALGIPTTRSLAVAATGEWVRRESMLPGALLTRVASSHLRVGTFEYAARLRDSKTLKILVNYAMERHFPAGVNGENNALSLLKEVVDRQLELIVDWMRVGFVHGVMNTDNMTISGETIDYGPCAFMNQYDPNTVFSSIDQGGRYAFGNQPPVAQWNLMRFAEALLPLLHRDLPTAIERAEEAIHGFSMRYPVRWLAMMRHKLGLFGGEKEDQQLVETLLSWMWENQADHTQTFRMLTDQALPTEARFQCPMFRAWHHRWQERRSRPFDDPASSRRLMERHNPVIIPRNHKVEEVLAAVDETGDLQPLKNLLSALATPYENRPEHRPYHSAPEPGGPPYQTFCGT